MGIALHFPYTASTQLYRARRLPPKPIQRRLTGLHNSTAANRLPRRAPSCSPLRPLATPPLCSIGGTHAQKKLPSPDHPSGPRSRRPAEPAPQPSCLDQRCIAGPAFCPPSPQHTTPASCQRQPESTRRAPPTPGPAAPVPTPAQHPAVRCNQARAGTTGHTLAADLWPGPPQIHDLVALRHATPSLPNPSCQCTQRQGANLYAHVWHARHLTLSTAIWPSPPNATRTKTITFAGSAKRSTNAHYGRTSRSPLTVAARK